MNELLQKGTLSTTEAAEVLELSIMQITREFHAGRLRGWRKTASRNSPIMIYTDSVLEFAKNIQGRQIAKTEKPSRR